MPKIRRVVLSCYDKTGIVELARLLRDFDGEIVSTTGTRKVLRQAGPSVLSIEDFTRVPEMMKGRAIIAAPEGSRRTAGHPRQQTARGAHAGLRPAIDRPGRGEPAAPARTAHEAGHHAGGGLRADQYRRHRHGPVRRDEFPLRHCGGEPRTLPCARAWMPCAGHTRRTSPSMATAGPPCLRLTSCPESMGWRPASQPFWRT